MYLDPHIQAIFDDKTHDLAYKFVLDLTSWSPHN